ncbi:Uncharacterised protein [Acinetobacter baumannii]|nr:Uncharacterised protein [Acinetobacter baumannii]
MRFNKFLLPFAMIFQFVQSSFVVKVGLSAQVVILRTWLLYALNQLTLVVYNLILTLTAVLVPCLSKLKLHHRLLWSF